MLTAIEKSIKEKVERIGLPLKDWDIKINYGIKTGLNDAFIIGKKKRDELISICPESEEIIRPILRGRDIQKYRTDWQELYLISTFPSSKVDIDLYPAVKDYLLSFGKHRLEQSGKPRARKKTNNKWFETQDSISYKDDFFRPKIVWKRIGSVLRFAYDETGALCLDSTCFATGNDLKFIVGYLNSSISRKELLNSAPKTGTGDVIISVQALEYFKIPSANEKEKKAIANLVDQCLINNGSSISKLEAEIDENIYALFGFSKEELDFLRGY